MIDNTLMIKQLKNQEYLYIIFSRFTNMPFLECDEETFDDQVHILSSEEEVQDFAKLYTEKKILLFAKKVPKAQVPGMLFSLFTFGINRVVFHRNGTISKIPLEDLSAKPDIEKMLKSPMPVINPTLTLSALYFLQEAYRPVEHDIKQFQALEEETVANLVRSKFILGMTTLSPNEKFDPKNPKQLKKAIYVKDNKDQLVLPVFSDMGEFQRFFKDQAPKLGMAVVTFDKLLPSLTKDTCGIVLNPAGYKMRIEREQLEKITKQFFK